MCLRIVTAFSLPKALISNIQTKVLLQIQNPSTFHNLCNMPLHYSVFSRTVSAFGEQKRTFLSTREVIGFEDI